MDLLAPKDGPMCPRCNGRWALDLDACTICGTTGADITLNGVNSNYVMYDDPALMAAPRKRPVSFGPIVRIPKHATDGTVAGVHEVTVKEAKRIARNHRKAAKRIEKAIG